MRIFKSQGLPRYSFHGLNLEVGAGKSVPEQAVLEFSPWSGAESAGPSAAAPAPGLSFPGCFLSDLEDLSLSQVSLQTPQRSSLPLYPQQLSHPENKF